MSDFRNDYDRQRDAAELWLAYRGTAREMTAADAERVIRDLLDALDCACTQANRWCERAQDAERDYSREADDCKAAQNEAHAYKTICDRLEEQVRELKAMAAADASQRKKKGASR